MQVDLHAFSLGQLYEKAESTSVLFQMQPNFYRSLARVEPIMKQLDTFEIKNATVRVDAKEKEILVTLRNGEKRFCVRVRNVGTKTPEIDLGHGKIVVDQISFDNLSAIAEMQVSIGTLKIKVAP